VEVPTNDKTAVITRRWSASIYFGRPKNAASQFGVASAFRIVDGNATSQAGSVDTGRWLVIDLQSTLVFQSRCTYASSWQQNDMVACEQIRITDLYQ
jgi:hypothetical protein